MNAPATAKKLLSDMFGSVRALAADARSEVQRLESQIEELRRQRTAIERLPPHIDDLVEWFGRSLDTYADHYAQRAGRYLNPQMVAARGWSAWDARKIAERGFAAFNLDRSTEGMFGNVTPGMQDIHNFMAGPPPDAFALVALLAPNIKENARAFILRLLPDSVNGVRLAERNRQLRAVDEQLAARSIERQDILDELQRAADSAKS
jgi:hypothetical protein